MKGLYIQEGGLQNIQGVVDRDIVFVAASTSERR